MIEIVNLCSHVLNSHIIPTVDTSAVARKLLCNAFARTPGHYSVTEL